MTFFDLEEQSAAMPYLLRLLTIVGLRGSYTQQVRFVALVLWAIVTLIIPKMIFGYRGQIDLMIRGLSELVFQIHQTARIVMIYWEIEHLEAIVRIVQKMFKNVRAMTLDVEMNDMVDSANLLQTVAVFFLNRNHNATEKIDFLTTMELEFYGLNIRENIVHYAIFEFCVGIVHYWTAAAFALGGIVVYCPIVYITLIFRIVTMRLKKLSRLSSVALQNELFNIIDLHLEGLKCVEHLERIVTIPMISQLLAFVLILSSMVLYIRNNLDMNAISLLVLLIVVTAETYAICVLTTNLSLESFAVAAAIYNSTDWYKLPVDSQKALSLMLLRAQKREGVTAAKFCFMDIERFGKVAQTSYSIYIVMKDHI
ncbi:uncharacterized protein LOC128740804 [Sabethes cyaneus]|uniref:uncharacterized protein LOC128740804 n=1 Tax=Sabethes cyaneus TaxID=53552 RepID=UPI00237EC469|nr:uncharacterized protein LOC128740804 [Sabethes cyaneus]